MSRRACSVRRRCAWRVRSPPRARSSRGCSAPPTRRPPRAHGDLGLVTCGFRSVADVCLPASAGELATTARVLSAGAEHFARAATDANPARAEADFVLGVLRFAEGSGALPPLDRVVAARGSLGAGTPLEVVAPCARLYLGVALAESLDLSRAAEAVEHLVSGAREAPAAAHAWLLSRALTALAATRPDLASSAAHALLLAVGDRLLDAALDAGLLPSQPALREMLAARVEDAHRPGLARAADAEALLRDSLLASDVPLAERALDALEGLADAPEGRRRLLAILEVRSRHDPAWSAEEALYARVRLLEAEARYEEAARLLSAAGHEVLSKDPERGLPTVDDFLDRIDGYGIPRPDAALDARCAALRKASTPPAPPAVEPKGRVYFVGGNEVQARYEEWLRAEARRRWPHVTLDFDFTGWSGNWGRTLAATEGRIEAADSVVVMQFIRTMLGRAVRSLCGRHGRPWVACTGHGRQSLLSAIERAVAVLPSRNS